MSAFFIRRPRFAGVIALVIILAGLLSVAVLPVAQFPDITPPVVQVSALFPGANAEVVELAVAQPIEEVVNGVDDMLYMSSRSADDGSLTIDVTFAIGTDPDIAAVNVQNRVDRAMALLPEEVRRQGVTTQAQQPSLLLIVNLTSPEGSRDALFLSNYASINILDRLRRVEGVGEAEILGALDYGMRIWLDVPRMTSLGITPADVRDAIQEQNVQVAPGQVGAPPARDDQQFQYAIRTEGRLSEVGAFEDIIIRARADGAHVRIGDVARVELGAQQYAAFGRLNGAPSTNVAVFQQPGANALAIADAVRAEMQAASETFPEDVEFSVLYDTTLFVRESVAAVVTTLVIALVLVVLVIFVFLQDLRSTLIPAITIPVSLIGTFAALNVLGFSINTVTLFALILAIGIVVDDAIVVVENVQRKLAQGAKPADAAREAMSEVTGPIIATTLVLLAVFVPVGFLPGVTGQLYQQFAVTIAVAVVLSSVNALTLSPALAASILRPPGESRPGLMFRLFNRGFERLEGGYVRAVRALVRRLTTVAAVFLVLAIGAYVGFITLPTGFLPEEDQGFFVVEARLPNAAALNRTTEVLETVEGTLLDTPGVTDVVSVAGFSLLSGVSASNVAVAFAVLAPWQERVAQELSVHALLRTVRGRLAAIPEADVLAFNLPAIPGIGDVGGFDLRLQDRESGTPEELAAVVNGLIIAANEHPAITNAFSPFTADVPQIWLDLDRTKAKVQGVSLTEVFTTLQATLGSFDVNDFNLFGRVYRVVIQADTAYRSDPSDILDLYVRNQDGNMVPLATLGETSSILGPQIIPRHNLFRAATVTGEPAPGFSTGEAIAAMEQVAAQVLPEGFAFEWAGITLQQLEAQALVPLIFALAVVFVYLFLVAQYESWALPFAVMLAVPLAALGAVIGLFVTGLANDIYAQIGMVLLIGLSTKNAILIVEFAKVRRQQGDGIRAAAVTAAELRFRAIMMTALSFILGIVPLLLATGAGAASRRIVGTTVFSGMLMVTVVGTLLVPAFYVAIQWAAERASRRSGTDLARTSQDHLT